MNDLKLALRSLLRTPGFTLIAVVTLALGIGANTAMFSLLNAFAFRPLPFPDSEQLSFLYRSTAQDEQGGFSVADYLELRPEAGGYGDIAAYTGWGMSLSEPGEPAEMVNSARVSPNFFHTLGVQPELGRNFRDDEITAGNHYVLMISHGSWQTRFGSDPDIIGRTVRVDGEAHEIVGVLPANFGDPRLFGQIDLFRPFGFNEEEIIDRTNAMLTMFGRRADSHSPAQAEAWIANFGARLAADYPAANAESTWRSMPLSETLLGTVGRIILGMLVGLSGFVLLIACSNLANFLLARTMSRAREFSVRGALGASRMQLLRPLIFESLLLAFAGGVCAIAVAVWTSNWFNNQIAAVNAPPMVLAPDWRVLSFAFVITLATALAFGIAPALFTLTLNINDTLKSGARGTTGGRGHQRLRHSLIIGQFALAMILLAGAGMFVRGLDVLYERQLGWESAGAVTGTILLPAATYEDDLEAVIRFQREALERLEAIPGVEAASLSYALPYFGLRGPRQYLIEGRDAPPPGQEPSARINGITPRYFQTTGTPLLIGRVFTDADTLTSPKVVILNQSIARGLFGDESPIGHRIAQAGAETIEWAEIVGVVGDVLSINPGPVSMDYQVYHPMNQEPWMYSNILVRSAGPDPSTLIEEIRAVISALNPDMPVSNLRTVEELLELANSGLSIVKTLLTTFAILGLGLSSLGIYGVIARTMTQRTSEFGIRMTLGAQVSDILRIVLATGVRLALIGAGIGLLGAIGLSRLLAAGLPAMQTSIAPLLVGITALLIVIALIACYLPARKASRINPTEALRAD